MACDALNVKPGDRAIIVRGEGAGTIVDVLGPIDPREAGLYREHFFEPRWFTAGAVWEVASLGGPLPMGCPCACRWMVGPVPDRVLRPLRDEPAQDERHEAREVSHVG